PPAFIPRHRSDSVSLPFPSTTLFRSRRLIRAWLSLGPPFVKLFRMASHLEPRLVIWPGRWAGRDLTPGDQSRPANLTQCFASCGDRKSTRLNSSHGSISYAVFCLKKK